jgi:Na+-driven multidrug efflux pump
LTYDIQVVSIINHLLRSFVSQKRGRMEEKESKQIRWKSITLFFVMSILLVGFILLQGKDTFFNSKSD